MGIIAWIAVAMAAALLATMVLPGNRSQGLFFSCLICFTVTLGGDWAASLRDKQARPPAGNTTRRPLRPRRTL